MDEILIEEKRYVSSKQAAKLTGYAKDYIGQLCREGRVPARLVGRSWYVLESAIQDHRFGAPAVEPETKPVKIEEVKAPLSASLESPRYVASSHEELPSIEDLVTEKPKEAAPIEVTGDLQEAWGAWFAQTAVSDPLSAPREEDSTEAAPEPVEEPIATENEVNVPIRAIHHAFYQPTTDEMLPTFSKKGSEEDEIQQEQPDGRIPRVAFALKLGGVLLGAVAVITAVLGSGYFDSYILSNKQVSLIAGVSFYNK